VRKIPWKRRVGAGDRRRNGGHRPMKLSRFVSHRRHVKMPVRCRFERGTPIRASEVAHRLVARIAVVVGEAVVVGTPFGQWSVMVVVAAGRRDMILRVRPVRMVPAAPTQHVGEHGERRQDVKQWLHGNLGIERYPSMYHKTRLRPFPPPLGVEATTAILTRAPKYRPSPPGHLGRFSRRPECPGSVLWQGPL